ncbi:MAG: hypothetical protein JST92_22380, partial [Deltaproteobacteria bacterium]|nr:hypothetical protein [Deltaproteobacteria bacterium]
MQRALKLLQTTPGLLVLIALLRSAGFAFGVLNIDESDYMVFGASILRGEIPYRDLGEVKPPLGYYTWVPAGLFGGMQAWPMRVVGVLWILATALLLRDAVRRWAKDELAGTCAAVLSILATLCEVPSLGNEAMMNLPAAAALWCFVRARTSPSRSLASRLFELLAGAAVGVASLYKLQAGIEGAALGIAAIAGAILYRYNAEIVPVHVSNGGPSAPSFPARLTEGALRGALLSIGFVLPWAIAMGAYAAIGEWSSYVDWVFTRSFAYAGQGATGGGLGRFAQSTLLCVGATIVPWTLAARGSWAAIKSKLADPIALAGVLFVWLTWLPVSAGGRFYEHYYLQFAPALALVGAPWAADLVRRFV